jgi:hypothetical protein
LQALHEKEGCRSIGTSIINKKKHLIKIVDMCALRSEDCLSESYERVPQQANAYIKDF